jgi:hypothetical protein
LYGVPWRIEAHRRASSVFGSAAVEAHFRVGRPDDDRSTGYFTAIPYPLRPEFLFTANLGRDIDDFPEADVSGITRRQVVSLVFRMKDGEVLAVRPTLAPLPLRKRFAWTQRLRFFDAFFPADQEPRLITAFDSDGRVLGRLNWKQGTFR